MFSRRTIKIYWKHENNSVLSAHPLCLSPSLSLPVQITLLSDKNLISPGGSFSYGKQFKSSVWWNEKIRQWSRRLDNSRTSFIKHPQNVYILSLNKTYIKYCYTLRQCRWRSVWNITKRVSSRENFSFKLCEFNVQIIAQRSTILKD